MKSVWIHRKLKKIIPAKSKSKIPTLLMLPQSWKKESLVKRRTAMKEEKKKAIWWLLRKKNKMNKSMKKH